MLHWTLGCRYIFKIVILFPLDKHQEVELLGYMIILDLIFWEIAILFSIRTTYLNFPPAVHNGCLFSMFLPTLAVSWFFVMTNKCGWCFTMVLVCISLMISEHLFLYLAIQISFLEKCLIRSPHFLIGLFVCFSIKLYNGF